MCRGFDCFLQAWERAQNPACMQRRRTSGACAKLLDTEWEVTSGMRIGQGTKRTGTNEMGNHLGSALGA